MIIHQETLEETQEVLLNCIETIKEMNIENVKDKIDFVNNAFKHLRKNVITQEFISGNETTSTLDLLKKIRQNTEMFCRLALKGVDDKNVYDKKPMLINWLSYYEDRLEGFLKNGK